MARRFTAASTQYLANTSPIITGMPLTLAGWFNPTAAALARTLVSIALSSSNTSYFSVEYDVTAGELHVVTRATVTLEGQAVQTGTTEGAWNHFAGVWASATSRIAYVNGRGGTENTTSLTPPGLDRLAIGLRYRSGADQPFGGMLSLIGLWNVALTADEIAVLARGYHPTLIRPGNLVEWWSLSGHTPNLGNVLNRNLVSVAGPGMANDPPQLIPLPRRRSWLAQAAAPGGGFQAAWASQRSRVIGAGVH